MLKVVAEVTKHFIKNNKKIPNSNLTKLKFGIFLIRKRKNLVLQNLSILEPLLSINNITKILFKNSSYFALIMYR